jgi:hypothetical protein
VHVGEMLEGASLVVVQGKLSCTRAELSYVENALGSRRYGVRDYPHHHHLTRIICTLDTRRIRAVAHDRVRTPHRMTRLTVMLVSIQSDDSIRSAFCTTRTGRTEPLNPENP